jgi:hypothetical protein
MELDKNDRKLLLRIRLSWSKLNLNPQCLGRRGGAWEKPLLHERFSFQ